MISVVFILAILAVYVIARKNVLLGAPLVYVGRVLEQLIGFKYLIVCNFWLPIRL